MQIRRIFLQTKDRASSMDAGGSFTGVGHAGKRTACPELWGVEGIKADWGIDYCCRCHKTNVKQQTKSLRSPSRLCTLVDGWSSACSFCSDDVLSSIEFHAKGQIDIQVLCTSWHDWVRRCALLSLDTPRGALYHLKCACLFKIGRYVALDSQGPWEILEEYLVEDIIRMGRPGR